MTTISRSALVMYSAAEMFDLVNDIRRYPEFLQGCDNSEIISESADKIEARLTVMKAGVRHSFVTRNLLSPPTQMEMQLVEGPFSHFSGLWHFTPLADRACKVSLELEFEVRNKLIGAALGQVVKQVGNQMVDAFVQRAKVVYG